MAVQAKQCEETLAPVAPHPNHGNAMIKATTSACLLLLTVAALTLRSTTGPLPLSYFMLVSLALSTVLIEVLFLHSFGTRESTIALVKLSLIMTFSWLAETLRFASILGNDTYSHRAVVRIVLTTGHVDLSLGTGAAFPALSFFLAQLL